MLTGFLGMTNPAGELPYAGTTASWFNPRNGEATRISGFAEKQRHAFEPPGDGDWVLVLDDSAKNYPSPGTPSSNQ